MFKRPESVLVVVYSEDGEVLLLRRKRPAGYWQSVTGSLEWRERPREAASRELFEETGLVSVAVNDCREAHFFSIYPMFRPLYAPGVTRNREHVFRVCVDRRRAVVLDPLEHDACRWVNREAALSLMVSQTNRDAVRRWVPECGAG